MYWQAQQHPPATKLLQRIEDDIASLRERLDDRLESVDGLLGRMVIIAGIVPRQHVTEGTGGKFGPAFGLARRYADSWE